MAALTTHQPTLILSPILTRSFTLGLTSGGKPTACSDFCNVRPRLSFPERKYRIIKVLAKLKAVEATASSVAETNGARVGSVVEIPVTCYQILGVPEKAEKDEVVKAAMKLKSADTEDGYTENVILSRQDLLMDVRDKILFEPEYAGNLKEKVPPRSSLRIPWSWLSGALCILQEVGEEKLVLEIGRAALQLPDAKAYEHDLLLAMALAECEIAKTSFEKTKVSEGFEALARAQYLLRSKPTLEKLPLLSQIEESLEELAPACTLEILGLPHTPDNVERKRGAILALRELIKQGLDAESTCRVQDWPLFLSQAMKKLTSHEIIDLISWDSMAIACKNKKSLESQNLRIVIDFDCFYMAMIAHIALGFSTRQIDLINKAKTICECMIATYGLNLKLEETFCLLLLGQGSEIDAVEKLQQVEINGNSALRKFELNSPNKEAKYKGTANQLLETWLSDAVLSRFADTKDCSPSLANFLLGPKRLLRGSKQPVDNPKPGHTFSRSFGSSNDGSHTNSTTLGSAVKQLAPINNASSQPKLEKSSIHIKRNLGLNQTNFWESRNISYIFLTCCFIYGTIRLFSMRFSQSGIVPHKWIPNNSKASSMQSITMDRSLFNPLEKVLVMLRRNFKYETHTATNKFPSLDKTSELCGTFVNTRQMKVSEAEAIVKQWQQIKAEALGPDHQTENLLEILDGSMLSKWQELSNSAKARSCFWRFVLLQSSVLKADIGYDENGNESAEIEALLEEAAELVDDSQQRKPSYYSKYKVKYILRRYGNDFSWRICGGGVQNDA